MRVSSSTTVGWMGFVLLSGSAMTAVSVESAPASVTDPLRSQAQAVPSAPTLQPAAITPVVTINYSYDSLGRLIQESAGSRTSSFTYDNAGNRTQAAQ